MSEHRIDPVARAQARADAARARLGTTIDALKLRASPQALAHDAAATLKGVIVARNVADAARRRPAAFAAAAGGIALFLLRHRVAALARRATGAAPRRSSARPDVKGPTR